MGLVFKNNAKTTLSSGVNDSTTTIPVTEGSVFPAVSASNATFFFATLDDDTNNEIVKVTESSGNAGNQNLTVVRAQESTSARAFSSGDKVELRMTAGVVDTFNLSGNAITLSSNKMGFGDSTPEVSLDLGSRTDSLHVPVGTTAQRPGSPEAGYLRYNSTTGRFEGYLGSTWGSFGSSNTFFTNIFAGDGSDTTFTLSQTIDNENDLLVFVDGVFQAQNVYSVSGTTLTFATAPADGRVITVYSVKAGVSGSNYILSTMTGDGSDTTLTLNTDPVNENNVQVYIDGVYQNKDTFSVSGTTLTFSEAPPNDTKVEAIVATQTTINTATQLLDADGDTKVMVEESSDEDTIRMDIAGTEVLTLTNSAMTLKGTTPTLTIGDAGAEDTKIVFDGNAEDYYVGLDDSADKLIIGVGAAVGTTPTITIDESQNFEIAGTMNLLGFTGSKANFTNSMLISNDAGTGTLSTANNNTGFGHQVFNVLTSGDGNTGVGADALSTVASGSNNTAVGLDALKPTTGDRNTAIGSTAGDAINSGSQNTLVGYGAGSSLTSSSANVAMGDSALEVCTTGASNTAVGEDSLKSTTGDDNVGIGQFAGANLTSGSRNVIVGHNAATQGESSSTNNNCIYIGEGASGNNGASNEIVIGQDRIGLGGNSFAFGKTSNVVYNGFTSNASWTRSSDLHKKTNIKPTDIGLSFINELQPVTFNWRPNNEFPEHYKDYSESENHMETDINLYGMIAQDVEKALKKVGHENFGGWKKQEDGSQSLSQEMFIHPLINAVKELSEKCASLQNEINELKKLKGN